MTIVVFFFNLGDIFVSSMPDEVFCGSFENTRSISLFGCGVRGGAERKLEVFGVLPMSNWSSPPGGETVFMTRVDGVELDRRRGKRRRDRREYLLRLG